MNSPQSVFFVKDENYYFFRQLMVKLHINIADWSQVRSGDKTGYIITLTGSTVQKHYILNVIATILND